MIFNIANLILLGKNTAQKNKMQTNLPTLSAIQKYASHFPFRLHYSKIATHIIIIFVYLCQTKVCKTNIMFKYLLNIIA